MKNIYPFLLSVLLVAIALACESSPEVSTCKTKNCGDYQTQAEAQVAFDADKNCLTGLDADNDGIACEELLNGTNNNCPTTSNCGCSNKTKSQCASNCCQWVVGTGCICR